MKYIFGVKLDFSALLIILVFLVGTAFTHAKLNNLREILVEEINVPKIEITNTTEFKKLCDQLMSQWSADGYAFYLIQPKGAHKTHKEKAVSSINYWQLPLRTELYNNSYLKKIQDRKYMIFDTHTFNKESKIPNSLNPELGIVLIVPIYEHDVIIGELVMFYNNKDVAIKANIRSIITEAQVLHQLLN